MKRSDINEMISLLQRATILDACRDGPADRTTITERAECSRATAYRATTELEEQGLVEKSSDGYRLTRSGTAILEQIQQFQTRLDGSRHLEPLLEHVTAPELVENVHLFTDATVIEADPSAPYAIEQHLESIIRDTNRELVGATSSFGSPTVMESTYEIIRGGIDVEWIITPSAFDGVRAQHRDGHDTLGELDTTATYFVDDLPLDFAIYDDTLVVAGFDDRTGVIAAIVTTENETAVEWGRRLVDEYRARGERIV
ncbi:winged helix-turn-helix domain-containing protein (plasmid) [Haladaptatus sp. SPP-AMP-3]|uniref:helix-turn-helix transcriptional regulator n=1 Tax=Haladaptatus sp. SPP-AMP-3 TaxID=3121295 RepID=UPI003C2CF7FC